MCFTAFSEVDETEFGRKDLANVGVEGGERWKKMEEDSLVIIAFYPLKPCKLCAKL